MPSRSASDSAWRRRDVSVRPWCRAATGWLLSRERRRRPGSFSDGREGHELVYTARAFCRERAKSFLYLKSLRGRLPFVPDLAAGPVWDQLPLCALLPRSESQAAIVPVLYYIPSGPQGAFRENLECFGRIEPKGRFGCFLKYLVCPQNFASTICRHCLESFTGGKFDMSVKIYLHSY